MSLLRRTKRPSVNRCGASAGSVVCGAGLNNQGIRVKLLQEQARGHDGAVLGGFVILDVGDNMHSPCLEALLHQETNAAEVLGIIRREHAGCVSIVNTNILISEQN